VPLQTSILFDKRRHNFFSEEGVKVLVEVQIRNLDKSAFK